MKKQSITQIFPWLVLLIGLGIAGFVYQLALDNASQAQRDEFDYQVREVTGRITQRMADYEQVLQGVRGFFAASSVVERAEFRDYVAALRLTESFPGIQGVGFSQVVLPQEKAEHTAAVRREGFSGYTIHPVGDRDLYAASLFIEPFSGRNLKAFGYDMYSEEVRRSAMERARDTDKSAISGKVTLVQEDGQQNQAGFLLYVPVYRNGAAVTTLEERRSNLLGWAYASFRMHDLMDGILGRQAGGLDLEIFDGEQLSREALMFDADNDPSTSPQHIDRSLFRVVLHLELAGHPWAIKIRSLPPFEVHGENHNQPIVALFFGVLASSLLSLLVWSLASRQTRATELAREMTSELQESEYRWKFAIEGSGDGLWDWNVVLGTVFYSARWQEMLGLTPNEVGHGLEEWEKRLHPEDRDHSLAKVHACLAGQVRSYSDEHRLRCKDGSWKWILSRGMVVDHSADGKPLRFIGTNTDITERKQAEEYRRRTEETMRAVIETAVNSIIIIDADKIIHKFNRSAEKLFGYTVAEVLGQNVRLLMPAPFREEHDGYVNHYLETGVRKIIGIGREVVCLRKDGITFPAELFVSEMQVTGVRMFVGVINDISERKKAEDVLLLSRKVFENAGEAILVTDSRGLITDINPAYERITGYLRDEVLGKNPNITKSGRHDAVFYQEMWGRLLRDGRWEGEVWDRRKSGDIFPKWVSINAIRSSSGDLTHYVAIFVDISDRKDVEQKLERLAFYDALTGLPNRLFFRDRLAHELALAKRQGIQLALMFIDLDRFKWVNDTLGHPAGDELLKEISRRLKISVRETDMVARLGGDEFTIVIPNVAHPEDAALVATKIIATVRDPVALVGQVVHVGASVGIAIYPGDAAEMDLLIKHADMAMYMAKEAGRNTFRFASDESHAKAFDRLAIENNLHKALDQEELVPFYQPKFDLADNRLSGAEALVRWVKLDGSLVQPGYFIPLAEETGLILPIGRMVRQKACESTASWFRGSAVPFVMAVNLSSLEFQQPNLVELVLETLAQTGLPPDRLELEITESAVMGNMEQAVGIMKGLRNAGIALAMDDFGTGYSSLGYLKRFPLNTLKIDRSFVQDLPGCHGDGAIVDAILSMAHSLKLKVVAEGVETEEQLDYLRQKGCETVQGYLLGKPMPEKDFSLLLGSSQHMDFNIVHLSGV